MALVLVPLLAVAACDLPQADPPPSADGPSAPLTGTFEVTSKFQVPATVAAPGPLGDALRLVHGLAADPGAALLDFAEEAGVPALSELRLILPDALEAELTAWIDDALQGAGPGGVSPHDRLASLDALIRSVLLSWELRSTLTLPEGAAGTHAPVALAFASPAGPVVIPVDGTAPVTAGVDVTAAISWPSGPGGEAVVAIGDHAMGVPFGRYAMRGLGAILLRQTGAADLETALAGAVACPELAAAVARRCLGPICVGHQAELLAICQGGVGQAAARIEAQVLELDYRAIHLQRGTATAPGATPPLGAGATGLRDGVWTATVDLAQGGTEEATATFVAAR